jgi:pyridoxine 4-dehydrogenase
MGGGRPPGAPAPVVSVQNRYNATDRTSKAMVDLCEQEMLVFLPWAPVVEADASQPSSTLPGATG